MTNRAYTDAELERAIAALEDPESFREAEAMVARAAPQLGRVLAQALASGGWFAESSEDAATEAARTADESERIARVRTLIAEETRVGMLVGVAVGWALARELDQSQVDSNEETRPR